ncbi:MAG: DUF11 domain-containing protein, partial [Xanthomonadales bacterium]|nr:DUF11 domain-containing protein [Xanthomonadales bacterium]
MLTFDASDFPANSLITDVDVSITWFKTSGSCTMPTAGSTFNEEVNFRINGPASNQVLATSIPPTWSGNVEAGLVTTVFDQSAAAIPAGTPTSGSFLPNNGDLDTYNGQPAISTWQLFAGDNGPGDPLCIDRYSVTVTAQPPVLINEVDADTAGVDALEFVELYDGGIGNTPLDGLVLVFFNGASDDSYQAFDLDGEATDANGYFVLGNAAVANVDFVVADNSLQNGADAVALYVGDATDFPNTTLVTATNLVDALVYDTNDADDAFLLGVLLLPGQPQINEDGNGNKDIESNQRCPDGAGGARVSANYTQASPTPGSENCVAPTADLSITKTDGVALAVPGASVTYTITASNVGPSAAPSATVSDTFPAACTSVNWTCVGAGGGSCGASGMGNINDAVNLPVNGSVTYTASCAIASSASGNLVNTATVSSPLPDPNMANNSATDTDTYFPMANVTISKDDGVTSVIPGTSTTYTIIASNAGPSDSSGSLIDIFPAACTSVSWTCVS